MLAIEFGSTVVIPVPYQTLLALAIPFVTALVTKFRGGNTIVHAAIATVLAALLAVWALLTDNVPNDTFLDVAAAFLSTIVASLIAYFVVVKPANLNAKLAPDKGI